MNSIYNFCLRTQYIITFVWVLQVLLTGGTLRQLPVQEHKIKLNIILPYRYLIYYKIYVFKSVARVGSIILFYILLYCFMNKGFSVFFNYDYVCFWYTDAGIVRILCSLLYGQDHRYLQLLIIIIQIFKSSLYCVRHYIVILCLIIYLNIIYEQVPLNHFKIYLKTIDVKSEKYDKNNFY